MFAQLVFDLGRVSDQIELVDLFVIAQRHTGAGNEVRRAKVTAHRVEGDLHQGENLRTLLAECKAKMRGVEGLKGDKRFCHFERSEESLIILLQGWNNDQRCFASLNMTGIRRFADLIV